MKSISQYLSESSICESSVIDDVYNKLHRVHKEVKAIQNQLKSENPSAYEAIEHLESEVLKTAQQIGTMR